MLIFRFQRIDSFFEDVATNDHVVVLWLAGGVSVVLLVVAEACLRFGLLDLGVP